MFNPNEYYGNHTGYKILIEQAVLKVFIFNICDQQIRLADEFSQQFDYGLRTVKTQ